MIDYFLDSCFHRNDKLKAFLPEASFKLIIEVEGDFY